MTEVEVESSLRVLSRRGDREPLHVGSSLVLAAETEWVVTGPTGAIRELAAAVPKHGETVADGVLLLRFGNAVGELMLPHLGRVEVRSGKWGEATFDAMLADLVRVASSLPFSRGDGPMLRFSMDRHPSPNVLYHAFLYLRHVLSDGAPRDQKLMPALQAVVRDPHRRWRRTDRRVPLEAMTHAGPSTISQLLAGRLDRPGRDTRVGAGGRRLMTRLGGQLPVSVVESQVQSDLDTPENRFVRRFLDEADRTITGILDAVTGERSEPFKRRLRGEAERCAEQLALVRRAPLWREVGEASHLPSGSTVLRQRRGYREVFGHWVRMRRTAQLPLNDENLRALVEAKDIALLYELWCYFRTIEAMSQLLGPPVRKGSFSVTAFELGVNREYWVEWDGVRLGYNVPYSSGRSGIRRAYSVPLRPDIVLEDRRSGAPRVHLLDAKFRLQRRPDAHGSRISFKPADVHKMHAYRDGIVHARTAWVLYPGDEAAWWELEPGFGVGVVGLVPGGAAEDLVEVLRGLVCPLVQDRSEDACRSG